MPILAPPPRAVSPDIIRYLCLSGCVTMFGWGFAAFGSLFAWFFLAGFDWLGWDRYQGRWEEARGQVVAVQNTGVSINDAPQIYRFDFTFTRSGETYRGHCYADGDQGIREGQARAVRYIPGTVASARLEGTRRAQAPHDLTVLGVLIFPFVGLAMVAFNALGGLRYARLLATGMLTEARVVAQSYQSNEDASYYLLHVLFHDATGRPYAPRLRVTRRPDEHAAVYVLYDPRRPSHARIFTPEETDAAFTISPQGELLPSPRTRNALLYAPPLLFLAVQVLGYLLVTRIVLV